MTPNDPSERFPNTEQLLAWTGLTRHTVVYDSAVDESAHPAMAAKVLGRRNIAVIGVTQTNDVFGGFSPTAVDELGTMFYDEDIFVFSFESHGRCTTPQRFRLLEDARCCGFVKFNSVGDYGLICFGLDDMGEVCFGTERERTYCRELSQCFEGLADTTLTGETSDWVLGPYHHFDRLLLVSLE